MGRRQNHSLNKLILENPGLTVDEICAITGYSYAWIWEKVNALRGGTPAEIAPEKAQRPHETEDAMIELALQVFGSMTSEEKAQYRKFLLRDR